MSGLFKHYENFPKAVIFLPSRERQALLNLYEFARTADDIADEGRLSFSERINGLEDMRRKLLSPSEELFFRIHEDIRSFNIDINLYDDLITAFMWDVIKNRWQTFSELIQYTKFSANPVGRIVLKIFGYDGDFFYKLSDELTTALQLVNFLQDIKIDILKNRVYIPLEVFEKYDSDEVILFEAVKHSTVLMKIIKDCALFIKPMFENTRRFYTLFDGGHKIQIRLTWIGGYSILKKIIRNPLSVFFTRPRVSFFDIFRGLFY